MFEKLTDVNIVGIISGASTANARITKRPSHTFIYKINGESIYYLRGKEVHLTPETVLYIPENESYSFKKISEGESLYRLVNFHTQTNDNIAPQLFTLHKSDTLSSTFNQMEKNWRFKDEPFAKYEMLSLFYHLVAILEYSQYTKYISANQKERLNPAIDFLKIHMFDHDLKIPLLADMCNMSDVTFRHLFRVRFGVSPKKYIINQRLSQAKVILESGEFKNISEVAHSVGYDDPLYFSKLLKNFYGNPPSFFLKNK